MNGSCTQPQSLAKHGLCFRFDLAPLVQSGFKHLVERDASTRVLTDAEMLKP